MPDRSQRSRATQRDIDIGTRPLKAGLESMIEHETVVSMSGAAGTAPTADTDDGDDLQVLEPYGFASRPDGTGETLALAPRGDVEDRVALGVSSTEGRPETEAGDTVVWCHAGHTILLDNDGGLTITAKDGQVIDLDDTGDIFVTPAPGFKVRLGGAGASEPAAKADTTRSEIQAIVTAISLVPPVGPDTGALIVAALIAAFPGVVADLGSPDVEVKA